jgi:hypothetical protein
MRKSTRKRGKAEAPSNRWADEKRTGHRFLVDRAAEVGGVAALERLCGVCAGQITILLQWPERGCRGETARKIREGAGIPIIAVLYRSIPIREVIADELGAGS